MKDSFKKNKNRKGDLTKSAKLKLPADYPWKILSALSVDLVDMLSEDEHLLVSQIIRDRDMDSLFVLADMWGLQTLSVEVQPHVSAAHISCIRAKYLMSALLKKFQFKSDNQMRIDSAIRTFRIAEERCTAFNAGGYSSLVAGKTEYHAKVLTYARNFLRSVLGDKCITKDILTRWSRHGPGSNLDTKRGESSIYDKYENWPYSVTQRALPYARYLITTDSRWFGALQESYRVKNNIPFNYPIDVEVFWNSVLNVVPGNRIAFVPKNAKTERSIAIEPAMNLMLQLGVDGFIRTRLKRWDIDLDSQTKNARMAYRGSIDTSDKSYVTLDLSMASDTLSLKLCEILLPPDWFDYLMKLRSPSGDLNGETIHYEKISSMGNGYTFVLESAIFAALCYAAIKACRGSVDLKRDMSIYGDDLIVRRRDASNVIETLNHAGFALNSDKSFLYGKVRESCGSDWFEGKPVRPVFLTEMPNDVTDLFVDYNRLKRILDTYWGITDSVTLKLIKKWIPERFQTFTGPFSDEEFSSYRHTKLPTGKSYQRGNWKVRRLVKRPVERRKSNYADFPFRKLMHDLRGSTNTPAVSRYQPRYKVSTGGKRFMVVKSYSSTIGISYSPVSNWQDKYTFGLAAL